MDLQANNNFGVLSRYKKEPSPDSTPQSAIDAFFKEFPHKRVENKPNHGIVASIPDRSYLLSRDLSDKERKKLDAKAQKEHRQAMRNLKKQELIDKKNIAKVRAKWERELKRAEKLEAKRLADEQKAKEKAKAIAKAIQAARKAKATRKTRSSVTERRNALREQLERGDFIKVLNCMGTKSEQSAYQLQRTDIKALRDGQDMNILRIRDLRAGESCFFLDNLPRFDSEPMTGALDADFVKAINSGLVVEADKFTGGVRLASRSVHSLIEKYDVSISAIFKGRVLVGWVLIDGQ